MRFRKLKDSPSLHLQDNRKTAMLPLWLVEANYYIACTIGYIGNILVIVLSMKVGAQEIHTYRWIISIQAAIEAIACISKLIFKFASFWYFFNIANSEVKKFCGYISRKHYKVFRCKTPSVILHATQKMYCSAINFTESSILHNMAIWLQYSTFPELHYSLSQHLKS